MQRAQREFSVWCEVSAIAEGAVAHGPPAADAMADFNAREAAQVV